MNFKNIFLITLLLITGLNNQLAGGFGEGNECKSVLLKFLEPYGYGTSLKFPFTVSSCE